MLRVWVPVLAVTLIAVVAAWWLGARSAGPRTPRLRSRSGADAALRRHPAGRARQDADLAEILGGAFPPAQRVSGPDDDPEFISALERYIHGGGQGAGTV